MSDYISRKAAVKIAEKYGLWNGSVLGRHTGLADCIAIEIEGLPPADVEPVRRGWWETFDSSYWRSTQYGVQAIDCVKIRCGLCGRGSAVRTNYCPSCGAKMDLEDENE